MRSALRSRRPAYVIAAAAALAAPLGLTSVASATAAPGDALTAGPSDLYLVQVAGEPLVTNPATKPAPGKKVDVDTPAAKAYRKTLATRHNQVLKAVKGTSTVRDYGVSFNGFAARLTENQADALAKRGDVVRVWKNEIRQAVTNRTPEFLGMSGGNGVWQAKFGGPKNAGAGMIVGVVDSGIWPESPSFAPLKNPTDQAVIDAKWNGVCDGGTGPGKVVCNNKLIGARAYYAGANVPPFEYKTPRGYNAHGTHVAATAAGNFGVRAQNPGMDLGTVSGMAPAARIASYKALWATPDGRANGATVDLVAAIDQAVADGVDVINYSVSGTRDYVVSPDEVAFFYAAQAGVFVSAAAGNDGEKGPSQVNHNAPWDMTVAASTTDRPVSKTLTTGDGKTYKGLGLAAGVGPAPLVDGAAIAAPGVDAATAAMCLSDVDDKTEGLQPSLDPAKAKGKIVLCVRGGNARVDKSLAVKNAGGIGMIHANATDAQSMNADFHEVPTIHINAADGKAVKAYIASAGDKATATISATDNTPVRAPEIAGFSSYGPALAGGGDLLKPDIAAPGVDIVAAVAPVSHDGKNFDAMSGTSMATPHIAGIAALVKAKHPDWSPMAVKSALMTTASQLDNQGQPIQRTGENATPLDMGAGQVVPKSAFDPALVYDSNATDWVKYACGLGQAQLITDEGFCDKVGSIDPSDLNYPSIAIGDLVGAQTVTRTVKNVSGTAQSFTARVQEPTGVSVKVSPASFTLNPGQSKTFTVTFNRTAAQFDQYVYGALTWQGSYGSKVRSPLVIRPVALQMPTEVKGSGANGSTTFTAKAGYTGRLDAKVNGLVADEVRTATVPLRETTTATFTVPAGMRAIRFATYDADYSAGTDLDIAVLKGGEEIATSAGATAEEQVTLTDPEAGDYQVVVTNYAGSGAQTVKTHGFVVDATDHGNLTVSPNGGEVKTGQSGPITLTWKGLDTAHRYLGVVDGLNGGKRAGSVVVAVKP